MNDAAADKTNPAPVLTEREQEIFKQLLAGATPKEIAYELNIAYGTFLTHQGNLYRKLDVHTINELLTKYSSDTKFLSQTIPADKKYVSAVFNHWYTIADELGSSIRSTHEDIKKAKVITFTVLGDGNIYEATVVTSKGETDEDYNFYGKNFITEKGEISTFSFNIDEISQLYLYGNDTPLNRDNIDAFYIHCFSAGDFKLKIWDVIPM